MDRRIGAQYYTIRKQIDTIEGFEESCRKVKEIGYKIVQISGTKLPADEMKDVLDKYGLETVLTHRAFDDFKNNLQEVIEYNKTLGSSLCGVGIMPNDYFVEGNRVGDFIKEANEIASAIRGEGLYFGYHNHAFEFGKYDGVKIMDRLLGETNPEEFFFIADTYWFQVGGMNPAEMLRTLGSRAMAVHFKDLTIDFADKHKPAMAEVGEGNLNWDEIISACEEAGVRWALVEQDKCRRDPFESLKMSYDYLTGKGFY